MDDSKNGHNGNVNYSDWPFGLGWGRLRVPRIPDWVPGAPPTPASVTKEKTPADKLQEALEKIGGYIAQLPDAPKNKAEDPLILRIRGVLSGQVTVKSAKQRSELAKRIAQVLEI